MKKQFLYITILVIAFSCQHKKTFLTSSSYNGATQKSILTDVQKKNWWALDIEDDTIPGISLDKAYNKILNKKRHSKIIVTIIDTEVKKDHEALKDHIWVNTKEIPNNNIDDDRNGYIDDIHGWNFLGNTKGENVFRVNFDATRIVREYGEEFKHFDTTDINIKDNHRLYQYIRAKNYLDKKIEHSKKTLQKGIRITKKYKTALKLIAPYLKENEFTNESLDDLANKMPEHKKSISLIKWLYNANLNQELMENDIQKYHNYLNFYLNIDYNDRLLIGDNSNNINDRDYGNNLINKNTQKLAHGTYVSKILLGLKDEIDIIPLAISCHGDEHDKDIALAIYYAVDNGAKVINISSGKEFSLHQDWVQNAILYAEKHNVLIVNAAGNENLNLDDNDTFYYPSDTDYNGKEICNNFIRVGASSYTLDENLKPIWSNYGKKEVDIFAPGNEIYTATSRKEKYTYQNGTSIATPIVSKVAALLFSYYPNLTASQVKQIIMDSGVEYTIPVKVTSKDGEEQMIPFNELSKSGKIVNAYNAFLMADSISKTH